MKIAEIIEYNKADAEEIIVAIDDSSQRNCLGNPMEIYFGKLSDIPFELFDKKIKEKSRICWSSDENRIGTNSLMI